MRISRFFVVVCSLGAVCAGAGAQGLDLGSVNYGAAAQGGTLVGGAVTVATPPGFTRVIQVGATAGDVVVRDGIVARVGSRDVDMVLARRMPWQKVASAAATIGRTIPYVATGIAFIELMDDIRVRSNGSAWNHDPGTPPVPANVWRIENGTSPHTHGAYQNASALGAMGMFSADMNANYSNMGSVNNVWAVGTCRTINPTFQMCWLQRGQCFKGTAPGATCTVPTPVNFQEEPVNAITSTACPASVDALNPANSIAAGAPTGPDGKCRTGRYTDPKTVEEATILATNSSSKTRALPAVGALLGRGVDLAPYTDTPTASGPGTVAQPGTTTTTTGPSGTTTGTSSPTSIVVYNGPSYTWNDSTVVTTTNGGGTTTTTTVAPPPPAVETCGLPGKPACKIDETGTPTVIPPFSTTPIDATKTTDASKQDTEISRVVNPGFGWFAVPPMATCAPIAWPGGVQINPCNGIEVVRSIMAYLWALYGAVWSFGVFRRSLPGAG